MVYCKAGESNDPTRDSTRGTSILITTSEMNDDPHSASGSSYLKTVSQ